MAAESISMRAPVLAEQPERMEIKLPKNCKENRYYYKHREEILEKRRLARLADPEYQAKQKAREEEKKRGEEDRKRREEEKKKREEEKKLENKMKAKERSAERAKKKAELLGVSSGVNNL